ncbi:FliM/FliN family flagellar motor switch protein [Enterovirga rhinocerotis]|uniref:Flagellar motor switch protein FliM n=1 Tax=Enterovirga rhinocerotis TaxID=1339210 RepID=A0A4R7BZ56_9HYPH|nr:FliM/FliN family flagellar motor switch protein [Enterovirga rhinocerotis]TDR90055.1 flagellar motor switch protein FliM [Enterovirga rhinocerotis]
MSDKPAGNAGAAVASDMLAAQSLDDDPLPGEADPEVGSPSAIQQLLESRAVPARSVPMLDGVFERMLGLLKTSVRRFTSDIVDLRLTRPQPSRFGDYVGSVRLPAVFGLVRSAAWNGPALIVLDSQFVATIIEVVFGGRADQAPSTVDGRGFSPVEMSILRRFVHLVLADVNEAFGSVAAADFAFDHFETNPRFANIASAQAVVTIGDFRVEVGPLGGSFHVVIPLSTLDPIREVLASGETASVHARHDTTWAASLANEVLRAQASLDVELFRKEIPLRELLSFAVGQTFVSDAGPSDPVQIKCGPVRVGSAQLGRAGDRVAVTVTSVASRSPS